MKSSSVLLQVRKEHAHAQDVISMEVKENEEHNREILIDLKTLVLTLISQTLYFSFKRIILKKIAYLYLKCCIQFEKIPFLVPRKFRKVSVLVIVFFLSMTLFPSIIVFLQNVICENFNENLKSTGIFTVKYAHFFSQCFKEGSDTVTFTTY